MIIKGIRNKIINLFSTLTSSIKLFKPLRNDGEIKNKITALLKFWLVISCITILLGYIFNEFFVDSYIAINYLLLASGMTLFAITFLVGVSIYSYLKARKYITQQIEILIKYFLLVYIVTTFSNSNEFLYLFVAPLRAIEGILSVIIGILIARQILIENEQDKIHIELINKHNLRESVEEIIDSENFLTVLRDTLPRGEKDEEYGLDYIPYMLTDNTERLKEVKSSTRFYFVLTLLTGLIITIVVVYFGYLLVNEQAAGTPKTLVEINRNLNKIDLELKIINPDLNENRKLNTLEKKYLDPLIEFSTPINRKEDQQIDKFNEMVRIAKTHIDNAKKTGDWRKLEDDLVSDISRLQSIDEISIIGENSFLNKLRKARAETRNYINSQEYVLTKLLSTDQIIEGLVKRAESYQGTDESRTIELIKRLGLSLVVSSFLLAILRYVSSIYRQHYRDMRNIQYESQIIRRFYIAMKASFKTDEGSTPNKIISDFVNKSESLYKQEKPSAPSELKNDLDFDLLNKILNIIYKNTPKG